MLGGVFHSQLQEFLNEKGLSLDQLIYGSGGGSALERAWFEAFSEPPFLSLGIIRYFPRMVRGLPRVYLRNDPSQSRVKKHFDHLPSLKRVGSERALFSLYSEIDLGKGDRLTVFTWVMNDGWGDLIAGWEAIRVLGEKFPDLEISWVALVPEGKTAPKLTGRFQPHWVFYRGDKADISDDAMSALSASDCILQFPTYYPHTDELKDLLLTPTWMDLGEYGFIELDAFHPKSGRWCLGLHCLEKGILIHKSKSASFAELKNESLLLSLFGTTAPGPLEEEQYLANHHFYLSYLTTVEGGMIYSQALVKAHERDDKDIDCCVPDISWLIDCIEAKRHLDIQGLKELEIYFAGQKYSASIGERGKKLRIFCPGQIEDDDFRTLVRLSGEFLGVRGDQSFSEAISANKAYFYDGRSHAQHFIQDLSALAENRIGAHRTALTIFRAMRKTLIYHLPIQEGEWVEELYFQEKEPLTDLGLQVGLALQDPDSLAGFKKLGRILVEEYSANEFLCHLIQRGFCHRRRPDLARRESLIWDDFFHGRADFATCFSSFKVSF